MDLSALLTIDTLDKLSAVVILCAVALSVITDKLVWHTRLKDAEKRAARWEKVALDALMAGATAGVVAAETAVEVVSNLPDPANRQGG